MEFNIVGLQCKDFENKEEFYARYPIDIVDKALLYLSPKLRHIKTKFHSNKLSLTEKKILCIVLDYFNNNKCPNLRTSEIIRSYPDYIIKKLSFETPGIYLKLKNKKILTDEEKETVCVILDELLNCSSYNKNHFKKFYKGGRLYYALKSLKYDTDFIKNFNNDTLSKSQKTDLCHLLEYSMKPSNSIRYTPIKTLKKKPSSKKSSGKSKKSSGKSKKSSGKTKKK